MEQITEISLHVIVGIWLKVFQLNNPYNCQSSEVWTKSTLVQNVYSLVDKSDSRVDEFLKVRFQLMLYFAKNSYIELGSFRIYKLRSQSRGSISVQCNYSKRFSHVDGLNNRGHFLSNLIWISGDIYELENETLSQKVSELRTWLRVTDWECSFQAFSTDILMQFY